MRLVTVSISVTGTYLVPLDVHRGDAVAIGLAVTSGTPLPTVDFSFQNLNEPGATILPANATWFPLPGLTSVSVAPATTALSFIPHTLRIRTAVVGDCVVWIQQNGIP
jgi:hypothetical protein